MHVLSKLKKINWTETSYKKSKHATKNLLEKNLRTENSTFKKKKSSLFFFANFNFDCDSYFFFVLKNNFFKNSMEHTYYYYYILIMILISTWRTLYIFYILVFKKTRRSEAKKILLKWYFELKWPKLENQNPTTSNPICLLSVTI